MFLILLVWIGAIFLKELEFRLVEFVMIFVQVIISLLIRIFRCLIRLLLVLLGFVEVCLSRYRYCLLLARLRLGFGVELGLAVILVRCLNWV